MVQVDGRKVVVGEGDWEHVLSYFPTRSIDGSYCLYVFFFMNLWFLLLRTPKIVLMSFLIEKSRQLSLLSSWGWYLPCPTLSVVTSFWMTSPLIVLSSYKMTKVVDLFKLLYLIFQGYAFLWCGCNFGDTDSV